MPRKSRRTKRARAGQASPGPAPAADVKAPEQKKQGPTRQAAATGRPLQSAPDYSRHFRHLRSDVRRTFLVAGICFVVVIAVYFILR